MNKENYEVLLNNLNDLKLEKKEESDGHLDYWFDVSGEWEKILTKKFMKQSMVCVSRIVYDTIGDELGIEKFFPFNKYIELSDDKEIRELIKKKINE